MIDINELRKVIADCYWPTSPVTINSLLDRLEATEEDRARFLVELGRLCAQCDALRAKVARMEKQEPVAWAATDETCRIVEALSFNQSRRFDTPLYALPGAKGEKDVCMAETNFRPERRPSA